MNRRTFLATLAAAIATPLVPKPALPAWKQRIWFTPQVAYPMMTSWDFPPLAFLRPLQEGTYVWDGRQWSRIDDPPIGCAFDCVVDVIDADA